MYVTVTSKSHRSDGSTASLKRIWSKDTKKTYFVKEHSDSKNKYFDNDIIMMLEFLVDNIFVVFAGKVFQQTVGIPMG